MKNKENQEGAPTKYMGKLRPVDDISAYSENQYPLNVEVEPVTDDIYTPDVGDRVADTLKNVRVTKRGIFKLIGGAALLYVASRFYEDSSLSPDGATREKQAQEAENHRLETEGGLGAEWSMISEDGWRVHYPRKDKNVTYAEVPGAQFSGTKNPGDEMELDAPGSGYYMGINIYFREHQMADGKIAPVLDIDRGGFFGQDVSQKWLLRSVPDENLDTRVVEFQYVKGIISSRYFSITTLEHTNKTTFQVLEMKKIENK